LLYKNRHWVSFILVVVGWLTLHADLYFNPHVFLPRDNWLLNFPMFAYISNWLKHLGTLPTWVFTKQGGSWIEITNINYLTLLPSRWLGTLLAITTDIPMNSLWKVSSLIFGQAIFYIGIFLLTKKLFKETLAPWLAVFLAFVSPLNFAVLHQEQVLALLICIPFQWLLFFECPNSKWARVGLFSLIGFSFNLGYPQHFVCYYAVCLIPACFSATSRTYLLN